MHPKDVISGLDIAFRSNIPVMLWGPPGVGKSSIVRAAGKMGVGRDDLDENGKRKARNVRDIRLALLDPTDLRGIPYYNPESKTAEWALASILPNDPESTDIIFLDEINAAPPAVQASAYQLVLDRRIGEYELPKGVDIVAAGNREGDKAVTYKMPTPLLNRFVHIEFEYNIEDWFDWAITNRIHPSVISYLKWKSAEFFKFDPKSKDRAFATPRTWEFASRIFHEADRHNYGERIVQQLIAGTIGAGTAIELMTHRRLSDDLPNPIDILEGRVKELKADLDISARFSMAVSLVTKFGDVFAKLAETEGTREAAAEINKENGLSDNFLNFLHDNFEAEYCIMAVRMAMRTLNIPIVRCAAFRKFGQRYGQLIAEA